jgi:outer membrane receptor protein involved in Fe transport
LRLTIAATVIRTQDIRAPDVGLHRGKSMRPSFRSPSAAQPRPASRGQLLARVIASCFVVLASTANAQSAAAALRGSVAASAQSDAARITATNIATGFTRTVTAGGDGRYALGGLPPGTYRVEVDGGTIARTIALNVGQTATLDLSAGGDADERVVPGREVRTSELVTYVSQQQVTALPQNARDFLASADLAPGVLFETLEDGARRLRAGGQPGNATQVFIDGVGQKNYVLAGSAQGTDRSLGSAFPQSAIAGYKVISQNYKAEYDQVSGAAVSAATRSGTNAFEGSAFYDRVADGWRASTPRELSNDDKSEADNTQYGVSFAGPIVADRLHFFVAYEGREKDDFTEVSIGENVPLTALPPALAAQVGRTGLPFDMDLFFGKLTWAPGDAHLVELSAKYRDETALAGIGGIQAGAHGTAEDIDDTRLDLHHQFSGARFINDVHLTFEDLGYRPHPVTDAPGYQLVAGSDNPRIVLNAGGGINAQEKSQRGWGIQDELTFAGLDWRGEHTVKMGAKYKSVELVAYEQFVANPVFTYDLRHSTTIPYQVTFGASIPGTGDRRVESRNTQIGIYAQDDWAINDRLMLNLGLRFDYEETPSYLDHVTRPGIAAALRGWSNIQSTDYDIEDYISDGSNREAFKDAWAPRLGFSYDLGGDETHVIFGGAGRSYDRNLFHWLVHEQLKGTYPN